MYRNVYYDYTQGEIVLYTWDGEGNPVTERHGFYPYYYIDTAAAKPDAISIFGGGLKKKEFKKQYERYKSVKDSGAVRIYHNLPCEQQFLIDWFGSQNSTSDFMKFKLRILFLDIEVYSKAGFPTPKEAKEIINLITIYDSYKKKYITWGLEKEFTPERSNHEYVSCSSEKALLENFLNYIENNRPDVLIGWNSDGFDVPYIINRIKRVLGEGQAERLSPVGRIYEKEYVGQFGMRATRWIIYGLTVLDYLELYRKYTMEKRESYKLDYIAEVELGKNKIKYKYGNLATLADQDWAEFVRYNIVDVELLVQLDEKVCYIELTRKLAYTGLTNLESATGTIQVVTGAIAIEAKAMGQVIPTFIKDSDQEIEGGYVREPIRGLHDAIVSFDANSLYPNAMISLNLSPETKIGKIVEKTDTDVRILSTTGREYTLTIEKFTQFLKSEEIAISRAMVMFTQKKKGICPIILDRLYSERVDIKKELKTAKKKLGNLIKNSKEYNELSTKVQQLNISQHTIKILTNSIYGYWANKYSPLGDVDLARSITLTGQAVVKHAATLAEEFVKNVYNIDTKDPIVVTGDTDSIFVSVNPILKDKNWVTAKDSKVTSEMYKVCEELEKHLNEGITVWAQKNLNTKDSRFVFKREAICDTALFIEKKRYVAHVLDDEGIPVDKFKYVGVAVVTTTISKEVKPYIKKIAETMIRTKSLKETNDVYNEAYEKFKSLKIEEIAMPKGIKNYEEYANQCDQFKVALKMPGHVKSAYFYNMFLDRLNITDRYEKIMSGDKIKLYYVMPNPYKIKCMAYKDILPPEMQEIFKVDIETMFEKAIGSSAEILYNAAHWPISSPNNQQNVNLLELLG
jgi:DNA polymerase elongation subunit (family B)